MSREITVRFYNGAWWIVRHDRYRYWKGDAYHVGARQGFLVGIPQSAGLRTWRYAR